MKKLLPLLLLVISHYSFGQLEILGSEEYGQLQYLNYDPVTPNKIYAATKGKHIVVSEDHGLNWEVLYSVPTAQLAMITSFKMQGDNEIAFTVGIPYANNNKIFILNTATAAVVREYEVPIPTDATVAGVSDWDFYDESTALVVVNYNSEGLHSKVYYTSNGGTTWDMVYYSLDYGNILPNKVYISPSNPEKLIICRSGGDDPEHTGGVFISADAGQNWDEKFPNQDFGPVAFHPNNPDEILLGTWYASSTQNLYRSSDGGNNWSVVDPNWANDVLSFGLLDIKYNPSNDNNIIVLGVNDIVRTNDNFQTKAVSHFENNIENPDNYYFGSNASFNPFNSNQILITNNDYPLQSNDGGATVSKLDNPFFFSQLGQLNLFENDNSKHLYYSVQNGYAHRNLTTQSETPYGLLPLQVFPFTNNKFYCDEYLEGRVYGYYSSFSNGSGLSFSNDHGANVAGTASPNVFLHAITSRPNNTNLLLCSLANDYNDSELVQFDISDPANVQQTIITLPAAGLVRDLHFDTATPNMLWMALGKEIYKTTDYGTTWELQSNGLESLGIGDKIYQISQNPFAPSQLTIATTQGIFTSINYGGSWIQLSTAEVQTVKHSDTNSKHLVAITYDTEFTNFALRYSEDSGVTWEEVPAEDLLYINCDSESAAIDFIGNNIDVYLGTFDLGVVKHTIDFNILSNPIFTSGKKYKVLPNPAQSVVFIQSSEVESISNLSLYDNLGKKIKAIENNNSIDLQNLPSGMYFLKIQSKNGATETHKIVRQ